MNKNSHILAMINKGKIILEAYEHFMAVLFGNSQALNAEEVF